MYHSNLELKKNKNLEIYFTGIQNILHSPCTREIIPKHAFEKEACAYFLNSFSTTKEGPFRTVSCSFEDERPMFCATKSKVTNFT